MIIGEYGAIDKTYKDSRSTAYRAYFAEYVNYAAHKRNIVTVYWDNGYNGDNGFGLFDRKNCKVTQPEIIKGIKNGAKATKAPKAVTKKSLPQAEKICIIFRLLFRKKCSIVVFTKRRKE